MKRFFESPEDREPASPDEKSMAMRQAKFIMYVGEEIMEHLEQDNDFPEWMQNKLSALHQEAKSMHATMAGEYEDDDDEEDDDMNESYINEKLSVSDGMGAWIDDFKKSDAPQFKGKSEKERRDMAIAAYLSAKRGGKSMDEAVNEKVYASDYNVGAKKSQFGGYTPTVTHKKKGHTMYSAQQTYKTPDHAKAHANAYLKGYEAMGQQHANRKAGEYAKANKQHIHRESVDLDEAKSYGPGHIGAIQRMLDKEREIKKAKGTAKKESVDLDEAKLSASQRDRLDDLILNVHMTTHPEYDGDENPTKYLNMIRKEFGDKVAKQVDDGVEKMHWGRDNRSGGYDKLAWRKGGSRITKSGKMNAQDVKALKNRIKRDKAWGGITKAVKLPEEVELDEKAPKMQGDWLKKERERNRAHDAAMGRTATGRKKPERAMTSTQRSLASLRK